LLVSTSPEGAPGSVHSFPDADAELVLEVDPELVLGGRPDDAVAVFPMAAVVALDTEVPCLTAATKASQSVAEAPETDRPAACTVLAYCST
jgi:hypothetical protein